RAHARRQRIAVAAARALEREALEPALLGLARLDREAREAVAEVLEREGAALCERARRAQPGRAVGEARDRLAARAQVALLVGGEQAPRAVERGLRAQAGERVEHAAALGARVAHVAARGDRNARRLGERRGEARLGLGAALARARDVDREAAR